MTDDCLMFDFNAATERLADIIVPTNLIPSPYFSAATNSQIYLKPENLQVTGAFKIRGAYNKIAKLSDEERAKGMVTASAGNHAQGVAAAAASMNAKATIVMPLTTPLIKIERTKSYGADVVLSGLCYDDAAAHANALAKEHGYTLVHPFNDPDVIEGQGTIAQEILSEQPDVDAILVPVGGGGLLSGIACCARQIKPNIRLIGVEPENAASMIASMAKGRTVTLNEVSTIADGTAVREPGQLTYRICRDLVDDWLTVSDFELMDAFTETVENHKLVVEPSGLLTVAATKKLSLYGKKVVALLSGGNVDVLTISAMINKGLVAKGRIFKFSVDLPDKPGELLAISHILAECRANVIAVAHDQFSVTDRFMNVVLTITAETNGPTHIRDIKDALRDAGYVVRDENA